MTEIDEQQCPLCLGLNDCGNTDASTTSCWCFLETIPHDLLEKIPQAAKGRLCICQRCLKNHSEQAS